MWNFEQLQTFILAAELKNFSQVAEKLEISAAAVGKQIKLLEENFRVQLFYRTTRHMELTEFGAAFYEQCKSILKEVENTNNLLATYHGQIFGKIKVFCSVLFGEVYVLPFITKFMRHYPELELQIEMADRIPNIEAENIDLVVGLMGSIPPHFTRRKIKEDRYILCASPKYFKNKSKPHHPSELAQYDIITHSTRPDPNTIIFTDKLKVNFQPKLSINNTSGILQCCLDGAGIAILHSDVIAQQISKGTLIEVLSDYPQPAMPLYLYFKTVQYLQPKLRVLIDFILANSRK